MIGFRSHLKESERPVTQDTLKLANKIHNEGNTLFMVHKQGKNIRNHRDEPG